MKTLTHGNPLKLIFMFSIPLIIGNVFQQLYSMADALIVGRTIGVNALAAVGCTGSITFLILGFINGMTSGLSILAAQKFGSGNEEGVRKSFAVSIMISLVVTAILTTVAVAGARGMLELLQTPSEIIEDAYAYLVVVFIGIPAIMLFNLLSNMIRALGDSKTPLYFLILTCIMNVVLDYALILIFHMGVAGAGVATVFSQLVSALLCVGYIWKKLPILKIRRSDFRTNLFALKEHLKVAVPMGFQMSIIAIGSLILQFALNGLGAVSVAAFTAAQKIDTIATMPVNSFGMAMATYGAQNYGAGEIGRIKKGVNQCILLSVGFSILMGFINAMFGRQLTTLFVDPSETEVLSKSYTYLVVNGCAYSLLALLYIYRFTLQGLGKSFIPTVAGVMELVMRAFTALVLTRLFGYEGACFSNPLAWLGACVPLAAAYYIEMRKLGKEVENGGGGRHKAVRRRGWKSVLQVRCVMRGKSR